ncbi:hypothetical protein BDQ17DRAFT_1440265 [Cyathus striatus]|nr:hypothetical protein BDQ17DRAFT_1440265 [Cyathus striatus]
MSQYIHAYRNVLRELTKSPRQLNKAIAGNFRSIVQKAQQQQNVQGLQDIVNATLFIKSQREHKILLERYNPLTDLTGQDHIKATARRVGLNMPVMSKGEE